MSQTSRRFTRELLSIREKVLAAIGGQLEGFPHVSSGTRWSISVVDRWDKRSGWTAGFWPGILWLLYSRFGDQALRIEAERWTMDLEPRLNYETHDVGFLFYPSAVTGYDLTGDPRFRDNALLAADRLRSLFNPKAGMITCFRSGPLADLCLIDTMANLPLLLWAHKESGDDTYWDVARAHASSTWMHLVREDGSTWQALRIDPATGQIKWKGTRQGLRGDSCWSRGQAWALWGAVAVQREIGGFDGFVMTLREYILRRLSGGRLIPRWDFDAPAGSELDTSSAAILADALLSTSHDESAAQRLGIDILQSLAQGYSCVQDEMKPGFLREGCFHKPEGEATDNNLVWGDYFYTLALHATDSPDPESPHAR